MLTFYADKKGVRAATGCFNGTLDEFLAAVNTKHKNSRHGVEYRAAADYARAKFAITKPI